MRVLFDFVSALDSAVQIRSRSLEIETQQEAKRYFDDHFGGGKPVAVKVTYKGKPFDIWVSFGSSHSFTSGGNGDKNRVFDVVRAKLMDKIWDVLCRPDVITWSQTSNPQNKVFDGEIQAIESRRYGRVVLVPKPSAQEAKEMRCTNYEFASWHLPSDSQLTASRSTRDKTDPYKVKKGHK